MEMHMVLASTVKYKIYDKTFVLQHVNSHLHTYLSTNHFMHSITILETL